MDVGVKAEAHMAREQLVLLLREHGVDLPRRGPLCRAVFLAVPLSAVFGFHQGHSRNVARNAHKVGHKTPVCPSDAERVRHCLRQIGNQADQPAAQRLGEEQCRPDHWDKKKQAERVPACLRLFQSYHLTFIARQKKRNRSSIGAVPSFMRFCMLFLLMREVLSTN